MDSHGLPQAIARLRDSALALAQGYTNITPYVDMPSYKPLATWMEATYTLDPRSAQPLEISPPTWRAMPPEWSQDRAASAHQQMAVARARSAWDSVYTCLVSAVERDALGVLRAAIPTTTSPPIALPVDAGISILVDATGAFLSLVARHVPDGALAPPHRHSMDKAQMLCLVHNTAHLATLLRGVLELAQGKCHAKAGPTWQIQATLSPQAGKGKDVNIHHNVVPPTPHDALMAMALEGYNSAVVPHRISNLHIYHKLDLGDPRAFVETMQTDAALHGEGAPIVPGKVQDPTA